MKKNYCVTANGPAATRWLSFVLASNKRTFVAHGSYPLDSVVNGSYESEKALLSAPINKDAVTRGREAERFIKTTPLKELYEHFKTEFPGFENYGCVHSFVLHELYNKPEIHEMDLTVFNLIRNPINYIASHTKLVTDAHLFAEELHNHYSSFFEKQFLEEFESFPEQFPDFDSNNMEHRGHVLSCYTIKRQQQDLHNFEGVIDNILMEEMTSDIEYLKKYCEMITGLQYSYQSLESFISGGALNSHRRKASSKAEDTYTNWTKLQKDIFHHILDESDLCIYKKNGYNLDFLG
ncbi:hypothetical protein [Marinomonas balearica]|uniref:Sulfotransferase family protein n=1 Tax=Marinomonas balearica TaxID=491947 RepID=A0A4R6M4K9_9GAMM|nr:hypothetical protein [Marinomonas balearica]TDO96248.1 hypothetical protein DFP79_2820 [Marinomonas balearica]